MHALVHDFVRTDITQTGRSKFNGKAKWLLVRSHNSLIKVEILCLSNIEVIGRSMAEMQLLPVSENKGGPKI